MCDQLLARASAMRDRLLARIVLLHAWVRCEEKLSLRKKLPRKIAPRTSCVERGRALQHGDTERSMRVLVVGDSGVGKTSVVHMLAERSALTSPAWTVGCATSVQQYEQGGGPVFVEFLDVGGQKKYEFSRQVFYNRINGK